MRILLTGATGTLGRELLPVLLESYHILCLGRSKPEVNHPNLEYQFFDFSKGDELEINSKINIIIHLAGLPSGEGKNKEEYFLLNSQSVSRLIEFGKTQKINKFIYASSTSVYGSEERPFYEIDHLSGKTDYALSKIEGEMLLVKSGFPFLILRLSSIYGKNAKSFVNKLIALAKKRVIPLPINCRTARSFLYLKDAVDSIHLSIKNNLSGIYNLSHPQPITYYEIANTVHYYFPKTFKIPIPKFVYKIENWLTKSTHKSSRLKPLFESSIINSNKIIKDLNYQFQFSFQKGFKEIIDSDS